MHDPADEITYEMLARHMGWVRNLAASLVPDDHLADDVVQEVWLTALRKRPADARNIRSWLHRVVRFVVLQWKRGEQNRRRRERAVAGPEKVADTAELVERAVTARRIVDHVLELPEPYRAVVLRRFFDDLTPRQIAAAGNLPVETVKTQLKRAMHRLRAKLENDLGGDRRALALALLPLVRGAPSATLPISTGVGVAAVTVAVALSCLVLFGPDHGDAAPPAPPAPREAGAKVPAGRELAAPTGRRFREGSTPVREARSTPSRIGRPTRVYSGYVRDPDGRPVAGARIRALAVHDRLPFTEGPVTCSEPRALASTRTDERGGYVLPRVAGSVMLEATAAGRFRERRIVDRDRGADFVLGIPGRLTGRVVRDPGRRLSDATVAVYPENRIRFAGRRLEAGGHLARWFAGYALAETRTGLDGSFVLEDLPPGGYTLVVFPRRRPAYRAGSPAVAITAGKTERLDVVIPRRDTVAVTGRVIDASTGAPLARAAVALAGNDRQRTTSAVDGTFRLPAVSIGGAALVVAHPGHRSVYQPIEVHAPGAASVRVALPRRASGSSATAPTGALAGSLAVSEPARFRLALESVDAERTEGSDTTRPGVSPVRVGDDGRFRFPRVPPGRYRVVGRLGAQLHPFTTVRVAADQCTRIDLAFDEEAVLEGVVTDERGLAIAGQHVYATPHRDGAAFTFTETGPDGRFVLRGISRGVRHDLILYGDGIFFDRRLRSVRPETRRIAVTMIRRTPVCGRVTDLDGKPVQSFWVRAHPHMRASRAVRRKRAFHDAEGRFELSARRDRALPAGAYDLEAGDARGRVSPPIRGIVVAPGSVVPPMHFRLGPGGEVSGRVRGPDGRPAAGVDVQIAPAGRDVRRTFATTDADGAYRVGWLPAGSYHITAEAPDRAGKSASFSIGRGGQAHVDLALERGARLAVTVRDAEGRPLPGSHLTLDPGRPTPFTKPAWRDRPTVADASGRAVLEHLQPGTYDVWATHPTGIDTSTTVTLDEGRTTDAEIVLPRGGRIAVHVVDQSGHPVAEAPVVVCDRRGAVVPFDAAGLAARFRAVRAINPGLTRARFTAAINSTDRAGVHVRASLRPGEYVVRVHPPAGPIREARVTVRAGATTPVALRVIAAAGDGR
jgi:RNA polymerase sigma-70 factor (ECF subfamily)